MDVRMPDGTIVRNVPEGTTKAQIQAKLNKPISKTTGVVRALGEGATLGWLDEAAHSLASVLAGQFGKTDQSFPETYKEIREAYNKEQEQFTKENPALAIGSNIVGGLLTAPATMYGTGAKLLPTMVRGGQTGVVAGAGFAPTAEEVPTRAALGGGLGLATPAALQGLMKGAKGTVGAAKWAAGIPGRAFQAPETAARQAAGKQISTALQRDQIPISKAIEQAQALGPEGTLADVGGENVKRLLQTVASQPGQTAQLAEKTLQGRMKTSVPRILTSLKKTIGKDKGVFKTTKDLMTKRSAEARPLYEEAKLYDVSPERMAGLVSELGEIVTSAKGTKLGGQLKAALNSLVKKSGAPKTSVKELHWAKVDLGDKINAAYRAGNNTLGTELKNLQNKLLEVMDDVPQYANARKIYSDDSSVISSVKTGKKILTTDTDEMAANLASMSKADMDGYLVGAMEAIADTIKKTPEGGNAARRVATYAVKERLAQAFPSEDALNQFMKSLDIEDTFAQLRNVTIRGSQTQQRLSTEALTGMGAVADLAQGRFISTVMGKIGQFVNNYKNIPEPVRDEIGKMLLSDISKTGNVTQKTLQKLAKQQIKKDQIENLIMSINKAATPAVIAGSN